MEVIKYKNDVSFLQKMSGGKFTRIKNVQFATQFEVGEAQKFINNAISKKERNSWEVYDLDSAKKDIITSKDIEQLERSKIKKGISLNALYEIAEETLKGYNFIDIDWETIVVEPKQQSTFKSKLSTYLTELKGMLVKVQGALTDINHYIETGKFSASTGYKLCNLQQQKLLLRRKIKNEITIIEIALRDFFPKNNTRFILRCIESQKTRKYEPRTLRELFETEGDN